MYYTDHTFYIPVMGTGFSIDSPIKVAPYGLTSVISLVDDTLIEEMRRFYCQQSGETYEPITKQDHDARARRITEYLNLLDRIVKKKFEDLRQSPFEQGSEITKYFELLPDKSHLRGLYNRMMSVQDHELKNNLQKLLRESIKPGSIDANIMTKLDRAHFDKDGKQLPDEFSDALSALRGYALSSLENSAMVFSAGINQKLYSYVETFKDFHADASGRIKKRVILKVSDYRSSIIQGKLFAKKGIWISEYRIESGINCGGHAFINANRMMGPILQEFKEKRGEFIQTLHEIFKEAARERDGFSFEKPLEVKITAQGGIGTFEEDEFIRKYYDIDATGWGTPFLLCPEVTNVDEETLKRLANATEADLYTSNVSPVGVPFNNLRNNTCDEEKERHILEGQPGVPCIKGHLAFSTEFSDHPLCVASREYQLKKIAELKSLNLPEEEYQAQYKHIVEKSCICHHLGTGARFRKRLIGNLKIGSAVCPGPNLAYFSKIVSLKEMADHIYGRTSLIAKKDRPQLFIKELQLYLDYYIAETKTNVKAFDKKQKERLVKYFDSLNLDFDYYKDLFGKVSDKSKDYKEKCLTELSALKEKLSNFLKNTPLKKS